jgi:hypothetical protein
MYNFEAREDHTYSVEVTARRKDTGETTTKTITVTVTDIVDEQRPAMCLQWSLNIDILLVFIIKFLN